MTLVDSKGRLFGIINVIDLAALLSVILIIGGGIYYYLTKPEAAPQTIITVFRIPAVHPNDVGIIKVGDRLVSDDTLTNAQVINVKVIPSNSRNPNSQGQIVMSKDPLVKDVYVTAKDKQKVSKISIRFASQEIHIGKEFTLKTNKYEFKAFPQEINVENH